MIKAVFFDLDGTLLPLNEDKFAKLYFSLLSKKAQTLGYEQEKFLKILLSGTEAMYKNESENTNEEVFWNTFANYYGKSKLKDKPLFDKFYLNEFKLLKEACEKNELAREIIDYCKKNLKYTILSTNPLFPYNANLTRMDFVGLKESDFTYITSYENSNCCKPNPKYFENLLKRFELKPNEVILFGNNTLEDAYCAESLGIKTYIVKGFIIDKQNIINNYECIEMNEIISTIKKHL